MEVLMKDSYFVHESSYVDDNVKIGKDSKIWHFSHIQSGSFIGKNCTLGQNVNIANNVKIGNYVKIQNNVSIYEGVEIEDYVFCGPSIVFTNVQRPRSEFPQRGSNYYTKTLVKKSASIGANATIVCGNTIGKYAFIGAGAVITKDIPNFALVIGNPGRIVGWVNRQGVRLNFDEFGKSSCENFYLKDDILLEMDNKN
jgi:UDP-2-acetamido-3-amino-2,3-dideoxy-glucuronate N-acetyltransferase